nr:MAG TPA: Portal protein [Bacteriophage sp.]
MDETKNLTTELRGLSNATYPEIFKRFQALSEKYGDMPAGALASAFSRVSASAANRNNPYIQNRRVQAVSSLPKDYSKNRVAEMLINPMGNEQSLRQVEHGLEFTAYPLFHTRKMYQDLLTYHSYIAPEFTNKDTAKNDEFWREWKLLEKLRRKLDPKTTAHQLAGQAVQEGKAFYYPRVSVDKPHNKVNYAFMQQLPSDWVKIVGFNSVSKYTVAFNMMYFMQPGTDPLQFGDLFKPYWDVFSRVTERGAPKGTGTRFVYAAKNRVDMGLLAEIQRGDGFGEDETPDVYFQNGQYFYWVTLPVDSVYTFEIDDAQTAVVSPLTGLFLSLIQIAQYEQIQLELVQNPLISLLTGEIEYRDDDTRQSADAYKLSNAGWELFRTRFYDELAANNTNGIGWYAAPLKNMELHQLSEAPGATKISTAGYGYTMAKAGLSALIPTSDEPRAGVANISLQIESRFAEQIYRCYERMMRGIMDGLNLKYSWRFAMFGNIAEDEKTFENARQGMTLGILPQTMLYMAMLDMSVMDDMAISRAVKESGIMDLRLPLVTSYNAKQSESGLPPQAAHDMNPGGRPAAGNKPGTEGQEASQDAGD